MDPYIVLGIMILAAILLIVFMNGIMIGSLYERAWSGEDYIPFHLVWKEEIEEEAEIHDSKIWVILMKSLYFIVALWALISQLRNTKSSLS